MNERSVKRVLTLHPGRYAVCRFAPDAALPSWVMHEGATTWCLMRTPRELSVVCPEDDLPPSVERAERGFRALELEGPIPFDETGVVAALTAPLARAGIPVFVLSTHDTDWLLLQETDLARAREALASGYEVR
jgi:hypothetical protein